MSTAAVSASGNASTSLAHHVDSAREKGYQITSIALEIITSGEPTGFHLKFDLSELDNEQLETRYQQILTDLSKTNYTTFKKIVTVRGAKTLNNGTHEKWSRTLEGTITIR